MRAHHTPHTFSSFPVYSSAFVTDDRLVVGGGGGTSRSGVKNKLRLYSIPNDEKIELLDEFELAKDEDAPMSMTSDADLCNIVCGINSATELLVQGKNENCRLYNVQNDKIIAQGSRGTLRAGEDNLEDYQKVTALSPDHKFLIVAGDASKEFTLLSYPSLQPVTTTIHTDHAIYDATFSSSNLVVATTNNLLVYGLPTTISLPSPGKGKKKQKQRQRTASSLISELSLIKTIDRPTLPGSEACTFRAVRFAPGNEKVLFTVINTSPPRTRGKSVPKRGYICRWDTVTWDVPKIRKAGEKGITCFDISPDGKLLGFGSADLTISLFDAQSLSPVLSILKAHEFPATTLCFNLSSTLFVSGSADSTVRAVAMPSYSGTSAWSTFAVILITLLALLIAYLVQRHYGGNLL
ncbi:WD40 repeat-like protein [Rickenella mellea]|uniref:WD40 repeat-like protein n=1 Tax=Rickenella mellea TaxID=50990 RepID=A0A4R5XEK8_9AGAM|nr:WD40 repeat-like protein [Rickenella mellea]